MSFSNIEIEILKDANKKLLIDNLEKKGLIFIYCPPKVGSTSLVSYIRLFASKLYHVIHLHDEVTLKAIANITNVKINDIIRYNSQIGRQVYVIDIYRSPIEQKISLFFEDIGSLHFNNTQQEINKYDVKKVINRFNKVFPHIANGDHYLDKYDLDKSLMIPFDFVKKYMLIEQNGVKYLKLRLNDSQMWGQILTKIFNTEIKVFKDYESKDKILGDLYNKFNKEYKIPSNLLNIIKECPHLKYYYSNEEREQYLGKWELKITSDITHFDVNEYKLYNQISIENSYNQFIQINHYIDNGCYCSACDLKRKNIVNQINTYGKTCDKIIHEVENEKFMKNKIENFKNNLKNNITTQNKINAKQISTVLNGVLTKKKI
jgi:hypothetical protein